ncbi:hypothetical protein CW304_26260 [Bacillus sp. UFRGS-B20]|nr:hypothetical protein CW304_26260 [Bacillus sp. UFRGS-B20]
MAGVSAPEEGRLLPAPSLAYCPIFPSLKYFLPPSQPFPLPRYVRSACTWDYIAKPVGYKVSDIFSYHLHVEACNLPHLVSYFFHGRTCA